jgi:hypothetical protein
LNEGLHVVSDFGRMLDAVTEKGRVLALVARRDKIISTAY